MVKLCLTASPKVGTKQMQKFVLENCFITFKQSLVMKAKYIVQNSIIV